MKSIFSHSRFRLFTLMISFLFFSVFQTHADSLQLVMPKIVYIGDTVEIRYIFHSDSKIFGGEFDNTQAKVNLRTDYGFFQAHGNDFTVKSATLEKLNGEYTLSLSVIPWKTGFCSIPPFNLTSLVQFSQGKTGAAPYIVSLSPVEVKSLVTKTGNHNFMPQASPLTLPGTTSLVVTFTVLSLILFSVLLFILLHLPKIARILNNFSYLHSLKKNSRRAVKNLNRLQKNFNLLSDKEYASQIQHILRDFLSARFRTDFSAVTTSKFYSLFTELLGGKMNSIQENAMEELLSLFNRLDYVRFSENSGFLSAENNQGKSEKLTIIEDSIHMIEDFDREEEE